MAGIISGSASKLALAPQAAWGTKEPDMSVLLSFTSESLKLMKEKKEEDAIVGAKTTGRVDSMGRKAAGDVSGLVKPDEIGYWLAALLGVEADPVPLDAGSTVFRHDFTPVAPGSATTLYPLTICVDRVLKTFVYEGAKVNQMKLDAKVNDYLRAVFTVIARDEVESTSVTWPARSALKAFKFKGAQVQVAGSTLVEGTGMTLSYGNNLEDDLYTADGSEQMAEIEPQKRDIKLTIEALRTDTTETIRSSYFLADTPVSVVLTFASDDLASVGLYYELEITLHNAMLNEDPSPGIPGPERLKLTLNFTATQQNGTEAITVSLTDKKSTKYNVA